MPDSSSESDSDTQQQHGKASMSPPPYAPAPPGAGYPPYPTPQQYQAYPAQPMAQPVGAGVGYYTTNAQGQQVYVTQVTQVNRSTYDDLRGAIPIMPMPIAIFCCVINFFLPGIGTIIASFCVFCCANVGQSAGGKVGCFCLNFWIGWLQLFTVWLFLFGWIWSIMWGWAFIAASADYYSQAPEGTTTTVITETPVASYSH